MTEQNNRRRGHPRRNHDRRHRRFQRNKTLSKCPICQRSIRELFTAITCKESGLPAHFDCVIKSLKTQEELTPNEKLCYLGNGSFGIITFRNPNSPIKFLIRKRIQYEEKKEEPPEWRKQLPLRV